MHLIVKRAPVSAKEKHEAITRAQVQRGANADFERVSVCVGIQHKCSAAVCEYQREWHSSCYHLDH